MIGIITFINMLTCTERCVVYVSHTCSFDEFIKTFPFIKLRPTAVRGHVERGQDWPKGSLKCPSSLYQHASSNINDTPGKLTEINPPRNTKLLL